MRNFSLLTICLLFINTLAIALPAAASTSQASADTVLGPGPGTYHFDSPGHEVKIPFDMFRHDIRMHGHVNGLPVRMFLDNGHLWDELLFFGSTRVDSLQMVKEADTEVFSEDESHTAPAITAQEVAISFPGIEFRDQKVVVTSYDPNLPNLWEGAEGQVSAAFLKHFVVSIDFEAEVITLIEPEHFKYSGDGIELPLIPLPDQAWAIPGSIELADGRVIKKDLMLDLGTGGALSIYTGGSSNIDPPAKAIETCLGYNIVGPMMGHFGRVAAINLGKYQFAEPLTTFQSGEGTDDHAEIMLGMETFRRFNVVFDYPGRRFFLEPNQHFNEPNEYDMSGFFFQLTRQGKFAITRVLPNSAGSDAGLNPGDLISEIDGRPVVEYSYSDLDPLFRREGAEVSLKLQTKGKEERLVNLVLRPII